MSIILTITNIEGEGRIKDTDLGRAVGLAQPLNIRSFVASHREELESYGQLHAVNEVVERRQRGSITATSYHLNRNQALLYCMLSRTPKGREVRAELIHRFNAYDGMVAVVKQFTERVLGVKPRLLTYYYGAQRLRVLLTDAGPMFHGPDLCVSARSSAVVFCNP